MEFCAAKIVAQQLAAVETKLLLFLCRSSQVDIWKLRLRHRNAWLDAGGVQGR